MTLDNENIEQQVAYIKKLILTFNNEPSSTNRLILQGAVEMLALELNTAYEIHFSEPDPNFLTYIRFYRGPETILVINAVSTNTLIAEDSKLAQMMAE